MSHARLYQACDSCRQKKVKCDLGSVDQPHDPPCARCRRENKDCTFGLTRKRVSPADGELERYIQRNKRRETGERSRFQHSDQVLDRPVSIHGVDSSKDDTQPYELRSNEASSNIKTTDGILLNHATYTSNDALSLLYLAGRAESVGRQGTPAEGVNPANVSNGVPQHIDGDALKAWSNTRFCREGLFTPAEAIAYIDYFYTHLGPLTPVEARAYRDHANHRSLLDEEPLLATTILTISSRYMRLTGPGATSRAYFIHDRLWSLLQDMIRNLFWAQDSWPASDKSLRRVGSCEALLLLLEWHPRSLHFPASNGAERIAQTNSVESIRRENPFSESNPEPWMEWSWRSERLSSSLLSLAQTIANQMGIFNNIDLALSFDQEDSSGTGSYGQKRRLQQLLLLFLTYNSSRLARKMEPCFREPHIESTDDSGIALWVGIGSLIRQVDQTLFPSKDYASNLIQTGRYLSLLLMLQPTLQNWDRHFQNSPVARSIRAMLTLEFGYTLVYTNSMALQAVVENKAVGKPSLHEANAVFFQEVVRGSKMILRTVVDELRPDHRLAHIPVRAYSRIMTAALFLLKALAIDPGASDSVESLDLVDAAAAAMQESVVDDVNLASRWGVLLSQLASGQRGRLYHGQIQQTEHPANTQSVIADNDFPTMMYWPHASISSRDRTNCMPPDILSVPAQNLFIDADRVFEDVSGPFFEHRGPVGPVQSYSSVHLPSFLIDPPQNIGEGAITQTTWTNSDGNLNIFADV